MSNNEKAFFNPVSNKDEKLQIFEDLVKHHETLFIKPPNGEVFELPIEKMSGDRGILCKVPPEIDSAHLINKEVVINFMHNEDSYFFKTKCLRSSDMLGFDFRGTLYILQTRGDARIIIPPELETTIDIVKHNKNFIEHRGTVLDLSLGGCKAYFIEYPENLVKDDILEVKIHQKDIEEVFLKGQIKSVKVDKVNDVQKRTEIGLQFIELSDFKETEVELYFRSLQKMIMGKDKSESA